MNRATALERGFKTDADRPPIGAVTGSMAPSAVLDAAKETLHFLQDVVMEVPYAKWSGRVKVQVFERMRLLAVSDTFDEIDDVARVQVLFNDDPTVNLRALRRHPVYREILEAIASAAQRLSTGETPEDWLRRVSDRSRRALDRAARTSLDLNVAGRAAAELFERELPKAARLPPERKRLVELSPEAAKVLATALRESTEKEAERSVTEEK